ncbi:polycomb group protein Psc [Papilio machaon]|uniref:polycomb group protein Psc n=1 Tax=Papilio machaon TaxID=76193 RepID=UPI001E665985|nr:polycomb group protein Psc [Papilio machaon]
MVTSNKVPDQKIVKMAEQNNSAVVPQRTLIGEVNEHITCTLCRGYYIDATTIVECLHSFCRSCIIKHLQVKSYCPVCEMMINSAKPNIKLDKALQDIVYKLVPGLFQKEMERRQQFYASRPGPAASATPEQRGEDTERIIFSPEDVISFSLEYADHTDADSISSKSSDSNEAQNTLVSARRFLQCPAVVNISHLKKFLSMKFDIDSSQFAIDILYKRVPLPDYYTLMDIAYIYNWKRNEPMRFFYHIIDYVAIRNRLFDINQKNAHFPDRKPSPTSTEETSTNSPAPNINEQGSEVSSGTDSPMLDDNTKKESDPKNKSILNNSAKDTISTETLSTNTTFAVPTKKNDDEVEKSQFLNSFELTARNRSVNVKTSPKKPNTTEAIKTIESLPKNELPKVDDTLKRKLPPLNMPEMKKLKIELEKAKIPSSPALATAPSKDTPKVEKPPFNSEKSKIQPEILKTSQSSSTLNNTPTNSTIPSKEIKQQQTNMVKPQVSENAGLKRNNTGIQSTLSPKRKPNEIPVNQPTSGQKTVSPLKLHIPKMDSSSSAIKPPEVPKPVTKKMPDLKPSGSISSSSFQNKGSPVNKVRMDLLANNSDPTMDRSKILSQVKSSLSMPNTSQTTSGDPLKSLFDSCKINIPSSLSITLTDQKLETRNVPDPINVDQKKGMINKNLSNANNLSSHKVPSPPVHNYIEILKLPETDPKKPVKIPEGNNEIKVTPAKGELNAGQPKVPTKSSETSAKGPIPNLKPISDTKLGKQSGSISAPITFQQTFEQQLQSMQTDKKSKLPKNKSQVPKLVPATPKAFSAANKLANSNVKPAGINMPSLESKTNAALDLSTPHNIQSQLGPQQTKAFETMQSIANLAKKQGMPSKPLPLPSSQSNVFSSLTNRPTNAVPSPLRVPSTSGINQLKHEKINPVSTATSNLRQDIPNSNKVNQIKQPVNANSAIPGLVYPMSAHSSQNTAQPSPRSQTRSPSSSPKLVIAEEKQSSNNPMDHNINQSNQITSTQLPSMSSNKSESPKPSPGPSKPMKPLIPAGKVPSIRQPITPTMKPNPGMNTSADYLSPTPLLSTHPSITHLIRHQMEMQTAWLKAQRQYDLFKNMSNMGHQPQNDFNNKDKQTLLEMSAVQATIPFKVKKKVNINLKKDKIAEDTLKIKQKLRRKNEDYELTCGTENDCSPPKQAKAMENSDDDVDKENSNDQNIIADNSMKPLVGREKEIAWLEDFLLDHLDNEESASLYISGQPGTGKTASLTYILNLPKIRNGYKQVYVNCTMMKSAASIYSRICSELQLKTTGTTEKACLTAIEKYFKKNHKMILLVLDEIDQLDSKRQSVLYTIFEWPSVNTNLVLVGIANALDLTERSLPRLQARCSLRPRTLHFAPYTKQQIIDIFISVLEKEDRSNVFSPVALQLLAAKIAAVSGDMRRALDIGKRVIELAKRSKFSENHCVDSMMKDASVTVELKQVLEVLDDVYGGGRKIENDVEEGLPMQQKLVLCSIMLMLTKGKNKDLVMGKLHDVYKRVARSRNIAPLDIGEMMSACSLLEARGALRAGVGAGAGAGAGRARRLRLQWDEAELLAALQDKPLLSAILNDVSCLSSS